MCDVASMYIKVSVNSFDNEVADGALLANTVVPERGCGLSCIIENMRSNPCVKTDVTKENYRWGAILILI